MNRSLHTVRVCVSPDYARSWKNAVMSDEVIDAPVH